MFISKKIENLPQDLDVDFQLLATELDISAKDLRCLSSTFMEDTLQIEAFDKLCNDIANNVEVMSFNDNTLLYDYYNDYVIIHDELGVKYLFFNRFIMSKIESQLNSYI